LVNTNSAPFESKKLPSQPESGFSHAAVLYRHNQIINHFITFTLT